MGVGGETVSFSDPMDFQNFLQTPEADMLWTDTEEIHSMCQMYQMSAIVVKMRESEDDLPVILHVSPDADIRKLGLRNTTLINPGQVPTMYLLLQGAHYELAVPRSSTTTKYSHQKEADGYEPEEEDETDEEDEKSKNDPETPETRLTKMERKYANLNDKYSKSLQKIKYLELQLCDQEDPIKTYEELEKDNISTDDLENLVKSKSKGFRKTTPQNEAEENLKCPICKKVFTKQNDFKKHIDQHDKDGDWTCSHCSFQTNNESILGNHKKTAHRENAPKERRGSGDKQVTSNKKDISNECRTCNKDFIYKIDLKKHINESHKTYKPCVCRFNHRVYPEGHQVCYECGNSFQTVHELMRHRKATHKAVLCKEFLRGNCGHSAEDCYYTHSKQAQSKPSNVEAQTLVQPQTQTQGFWDISSRKEPPSEILSARGGPSPLEWEQIKNMLAQLNQIVGTFVKTNQ